MAWYDWLLGGGDAPYPGIGSFFDNNRSSVGSGGSDQNLMDLMSQIIDEYSYKPQYTGQTEKGLYDLFNQLTGLGGGGVNAIPFDIGLPTTGLYDALTRGIKEEYLGTPGGPEGGRISDLKAYYNNLGIPEQAINQERLANRDLNNLLTDQAAKINESQKDRLLQVLGLGTGVGQNLYSQNLGQHRANAGLMGSAATTDYALQDLINQTNASSLSSLLSGAGTLATTAGTATGQPELIAAGALANLLKPTTTPINRSGGSSAYSNPYGKNYSSVAKLIQ